MLRMASKPRPAWENRFKVPSLRDLRAGFNRQLGGLVDMARAELLVLPGVRDELGWHGIPWRWSIAFRCPPPSEPTLAFLILEPGRPQVCIPFPENLLTALHARPWSRGIREGIVFSPRVNGIHWPQWELTSKPQTAELLAIARLTHGARARRN